MESGKRKYEADVNDGAVPSEKRSKFSNETVTLLDLSDDVLMYVLRLLSSHDLLNLSDVCERFDRITADETLWKVVDTKFYLGTYLRSVRYKDFFHIYYLYVWK